MDKALATMLLTVGGFIGAMALLALVLPSITSTGNAIASDRAGVGTQSREAISVVNALSELDGTGAWQDTDGDTYFDLYVWVKNTGGVTIGKAAEVDLFVHSEGIAERIPHANDTAGYPRWTAAVEGGGGWEAGATLKITVHYQTAITAGDHVIEAATANGAGDASRFTL